MIKAIMDQTNQNPPQAPKKPGFFARLFGGSKQTGPSVPAAPVSPSASSPMDMPVTPAETTLGTRSVAPEQPLPSATPVASTDISPSAPPMTEPIEPVVPAPAASSQELSASDESAMNKQLEALGAEPLASPSSSVDTPSPASTPQEPVTPPSDPMVTPIQPLVKPATDAPSSETSPVSDPETQPPVTPPAA